MPEEATHRRVSRKGPSLPLLSLAFLTALPFPGGTKHEFFFPSASHAINNVAAERRRVPERFMQWRGSSQAKLLKICTKQSIQSNPFLEYAAPCHCVKIQFQEVTPTTRTNSVSPTLTKHKKNGRDHSFPPVSSLVSPSNLPN